jgi:hypothetical protein
MAKGRRPNATGRGGGGRFVALPHYMLRSAAWKTLSPNAKALLIDIWERHNGTNNGGISYAVREAGVIGLSKDQAARAFAELIERQFLQLRCASTFAMKSNAAREWELTAEPVGSDPQKQKAPTRDFMRWQPAAAISLSHQRDAQSHQRDSKARSKSISRSHQRDAQSHQRDSEPFDATILPGAVAPARPSAPFSGGSQSHQRDTSILPRDADSAGGDVRPNAAPLEAAKQPHQSVGTTLAWRAPYVLDASSDLLHMLDTKAERRELAAIRDGHATEGSSKKLAPTNFANLAVD